MADVRLIGLGGTISMREVAGGAVPVHGAAHLAEQVDGISGAEDLALVGGSEVGFALLERLVRRGRELVADGVDGLVVTTGTDSIEEVGTWLAYRERWPVPVVVTGSMIAGDRADSDGPANLADAAAVAASGADTDPVVVFAGKVFGSREVLKVSGLTRDAFDAPGRGPIAVVAPGEVLWHRVPARRIAHGDPTGPIVPVPIVVAALDDDGALLEAAGARHRVVVVAANGAGNLPPGQAEAAERLLRAGGSVVITTRATDSRVAPVYGYPGGVATLVAAGAVLAPNLTPHRARLLVGLGLARGLDNRGLRALVELEAA
ncbi:asparaginase domain-containing protein [Nocardia xishanensis]